MTTLYKKGSQYHSKFGGVYYDYDIVKTKDDTEITKLLKGDWRESLPETVKAKSKPKAKADKQSGYDIIREFNSSLFIGEI